jgi:hypothetical protein
MENCKNCKTEFSIQNPKVKYYGQIVCKNCYIKINNLSHQIDELSIYYKKNFNLEFFENIVKLHDTQTNTKI